MKYYGIMILFEIFGMIINHTSTGIQTNRLHHDIVDVIPNTEIISVESQTVGTPSACYKYSMKI
jgi:hypothetical protein